MIIVLALLFVLLTSECITFLFSGSNKRQSSVFTLVVFLSVVPIMMPHLFNYNQGALVGKLDQLSTILKVILPLLAASLIYSIFQVVFSRNISKLFAGVIGIFRPIWMIGFVIFSVRNMSSVVRGLLP